MEIEYFEKDESKAIELMKSAPSVAFSEVPVWDAETSPQFRSENGCIDLAFGFSLCWELDLANLVVIITLKFKGMELGSWRLDKDHTSVHIGINVGFAKASLDLAVDWINRKITLKGEVCFMGSCKRFDVVLFQW